VTSPLFLLQVNEDYTISEETLGIFISLGTAAVSAAGGVFMEKYLAATAANRAKVMMVVMMMMMMVVVVVVVAVMMMMMMMTMMMMMMMMMVMMMMMMMTHHQVVCENRSREVNIDSLLHSGFSIGYSNRSLGAPIDRDELVTELRGDKCQHVAVR
jgi:hypothetical protein